MWVESEIHVILSTVEFTRLHTLLHMHTHTHTRTCTHAHTHTGGVVYQGGYLDTVRVQEIGHLSRRPRQNEPNTVTIVTDTV